MNQEYENFINTKEDNGVYRISIYFPNKENEIPIIETNIKTVVNTIQSFLVSNMERFLYLENMVGNLGWVAFCDAFNPLLFVIKTALTKKHVFGVYLKLLVKAEEFDKYTGEMKNSELVYDTRIKGQIPSALYMLCLDTMYESICMAAASLFDDNEENDDNEDDSVYNNLVDTILSDELVEKLKDLYTNKITEEAFLEFLKYSSTEESDMYNETK